MCFEKRQFFPFFPFFPVKTSFSHSHGFISNFPGFFPTLLNFHYEKRKSGATGL
jgi:hypothetical protein